MAHTKKKNQSKNATPNTKSPSPGESTDVPEFSFLTDNSCTNCGENVDKVLSAISGLRQTTESKFKELSEELSSIKASMESRLTIQEDTTKDLTNRIKVLESDLHALKVSHENDSKKLVELQDRVLNNESHNRRLNLVFGNIPESDNENVRESINRVLIENLKIPEDKAKGFLMRDLHRLGRVKNNDEANVNNALVKPRNIITAFVLQEDRNFVYSRAKNLKGSNITMRVDLTKEHAKKRDNLMVHRRNIINFNDKLFVKLSYRQYNHPILLVKINNKIVEFNDKMNLEQLEIVNGR